MESMSIDSLDDSIIIEEAMIKLEEKIRQLHNIERVTHTLVEETLRLHKETVKIERATYTLVEDTVRLRRETAKKIANMRMIVQSLRDINEIP
ncbi:uncharacterized protein TRIVIDRAFT_224126 [Trichoderma virens Gv29-8]|uniref:Uncharacterized protein n=1 Tax=Hypocrea virens (strain Gv29-8 / FGSC 10586) TaxID=413071 RepID=G9MZ84_HYPVG|nr:uncharacterized protein TRIVIDRAFT_224126 [Trichoderma virens Gv29-8]EHK20410.1 hypothetical protein TRIVIDRAFT_224126 [Trichoderma virens Gv29-8]UKZ47068.1 hypothetical protein TrVGV298_001282 [Trichoderma virens]UKZ73642.1 hypothetical protein TrVFT333_001292 [Trichoderma virens FT-333]